MNRRRRIYSELLPLDVVKAPRTLALLRRYGLELSVAVRPDSVARLPDLVAACADTGVPVALWPMLADEDGRWASAANAGMFAAFTARILGELDRRGLAARELILDLEPPIAAVRGALAGGRGALSSIRGAPSDPAWARAAEAYAELSRGLHARGVATSAAVVPLVLLDGPERGWERSLGTPVSAVAWRRADVMLYTSMIEGLSRGLVRRADAVALLAWGCRAARARFGAAAGASLGAVSVGALGDEPVYRSPEELRADVAVAVGAGIDDLALFDLGGVLSRPPPEAWLEAFIAPPLAPDASPHVTARAQLSLLAGVLLGRGAAVLRAGLAARGAM